MDVPKKSTATKTKTTQNIKNKFYSVSLDSDGDGYIDEQISYEKTDIATTVESITEERTIIAGKPQEILNYLMEWIVRSINALFGNKEDLVFNDDLTEEGLKPGGDLSHLSNYDNFNSGTISLLQATYRWFTKTSISTYIDETTSEELTFTDWSEGEVVEYRTYTDLFDNREADIDFLQFDEPIVVVDTQTGKETEEEPEPYLSLADPAELGWETDIWGNDQVPTKFDTCTTVSEDEITTHTYFETIKESVNLRIPNRFSLMDDTYRNYGQLNDGLTLFENVEGVFITPPSGKVYYTSDKDLFKSRNAKTEGSYFYVDSDFDGFYETVYVLAPAEIEDGKEIYDVISVGFNYDGSHDFVPYEKYRRSPNSVETTFDQIKHEHPQFEGYSWQYHLGQLKDIDLLFPKDLSDGYEPKDHIFEIWKLNDFTKSDKFTTLFYETKKNTHAEAWETYSKQIVRDTFEQVIMTITASAVSSIVQCLPFAGSVLGTLAYLGVYTLMSKFAMDAKAHEAQSRERAFTYLPVGGQEEPTSISERCNAERVLGDSMPAALAGHPGAYYTTVRGGEIGNMYTAQAIVSPPNDNRKFYGMESFLDPIGALSQFVGLIVAGMASPSNYDPNGVFGLDFDNTRLDYEMVTCGLKALADDPYYSVDTFPCYDDHHWRYRHNTLGYLEQEIARQTWNSGLKKSELNAIKPICVDGKPEYIFVDKNQEYLPNSYMHHPIVVSQDRYEYLNSKGLTRSWLSIATLCVKAGSATTFGVDPSVLNEKDRDLGYVTKIPISEGAFFYPITNVYIETWFDSEVVKTPIDSSEYDLVGGSLSFRKTLEELSNFEEEAGKRSFTQVAYLVYVEFERIIGEQSEFALPGQALAQETSYAIKEYFNQYTFARVSEQMLCEIGYTALMTAISTTISTIAIMAGSYLTKGIQKALVKIGAKLGSSKCKELVLKGITQTAQKSLAMQIVSGAGRIVGRTVEEVFEEIVIDGFVETVTENLVGIYGGNEEWAYWVSTLVTSARETVDARISAETDSKQDSTNIFSQKAAELVASREGASIGELKKEFQKITSSLKTTLELNAWSALEVMKCAKQVVASLAYKTVSLAAKSSAILLGGMNFYTALKTTHKLSFEKLSPKSMIKHLVLLRRGQTQISTREDGDANAPKAGFLSAIDLNLDGKVRQDTGVEIASMTVKRVASAREYAPDPINSLEETAVERANNVKRKENVETNEEIIGDMRARQGCEEDFDANVKKGGVEVMRIEVEVRRTGEVITLEVQPQQKISVLVDHIVKHLETISEQRAHALVFSGHELSPDSTIGDVVDQFGLVEFDTMGLWAKVVAGAPSSYTNIKNNEKFQRLLKTTGFIFGTDKEAEVILTSIFAHAKSFNDAINFINKLNDFVKEHYPLINTPQFVREILKDEIREAYSELGLSNDQIQNIYDNTIGKIIPTGPMFDKTIEKYAKFVDAMRDTFAMDVMKEVIRIYENKGNNFGAQSPPAKLRNVFQSLYDVFTNPIKKKYLEQNLKHIMKNFKQDLTGLFFTTPNQEGVTNAYTKFSDYEGGLSEADVFLKHVPKVLNKFFKETGLKPSLLKNINIKQQFESSLAKKGKPSINLPDKVRSLDSGGRWEVSFEDEHGVTHHYIFVFPTKASIDPSSSNSRDALVDAGTTIYVIGEENRDGPIKLYVELENTRDKKLSSFKAYFKELVTFLEGGTIERGDKVYEKFGLDTLFNSGGDSKGFLNDQREEGIIKLLNEEIWKRNSWSPNAITASKFKSDLLKITKEKAFPFERSFIEEYIHNVLKKQEKGIFPEDTINNLKEIKDFIKRLAGQLELVEYQVVDPQSGNIITLLGIEKKTDTNYFVRAKDEQGNYYQGVSPSALGIFKGVFRLDTSETFEGWYENAFDLDHEYQIPSGFTDVIDFTTRVVYRIKSDGSIEYALAETSSSNEVRLPHGWSEGIWISESGIIRRNTNLPSTAKLIKNAMLTDHSGCFLSSEFFDPSDPSSMFKLKNIDNFKEEFYASSNQIKDSYDQPYGINVIVSVSKSDKYAYKNTLIDVGLTHRAFMSQSEDTYFKLRDFTSPFKKFLDEAKRFKGQEDQLGTKGILVTDLQAPQIGEKRKASDLLSVWELNEFARYGLLIEPEGQKVLTARMLEGQEGKTNFFLRSILYKYNTPVSPTTGVVKWDMARSDEDVEGIYNELKEVIITDPNVLDEDPEINDDFDNKFFMNFDELSWKRFVFTVSEKIKAYAGENEFILKAQDAINSIPNYDLNLDLENNPKGIFTTDNEVKTGVRLMEIIEELMGSGTFRCAYSRMLSMLFVGGTEKLITKNRPSLEVLESLYEDYGIYPDTVFNPSSIWSAPPALSAEDIKENEFSYFFGETRISLPVSDDVLADNIVTLQRLNNPAITESTFVEGDYYAQLQNKLLGAYLPSLVKETGLQKARRCSDMGYKILNLIQKDLREQTSKRIDIDTNIFVSNFILEYMRGFFVSGDLRNGLRRIFNQPFDDSVSVRFWYQGNLFEIPIWYRGFVKTPFRDEVSDMTMDFSDDFTDWDLARALLRHEGIKALFEDYGISVEDFVAEFLVD